MQLFYNQEITAHTESFFFEREESKHIIKVMRKQRGDILHVTNGLGYIFITEIELASDNKCTVKIVSFEKAAERTYHLHLAVAPTKMNDRYEWFLEKATEMGVSEITPIICDHSERKNLKSERLDKILQSAMKQSLQYYLPKLNEPMAFKDFIALEQSGTKLIAHCEESNKKSLKNTLQKRQDVTILIGPEGDFSQNEINLAVENKYIPVSLGTTRLRTETAAIAACHSVMFINE